MNPVKDAAPLVSVVLPVHNGAKFLRQSIDSCLKQTHRDLELIVVDDASRDATPKVIEAVKDPRLVHLRNQRNLGLPATLNVGFSRARGEYLSWTSYDNWYDPEAMARMLAFLVAERAAFVCSDFFVVSEEGAGAERLLQVPDEHDFAQENRIGPCFLYHRSVKNAVGDYDEEAQLAEDYDYWIRVAKHCSIHRLNEPLYHYRRHDDSLTATAARSHAVEIAGALVRIKNGLTTPATEAERLGTALSEMRYRAAGLPVRAAGRLMRVLSGGRLEAAREFKFKGARADCLAAFGDYHERDISLAEAASKLTVLFTEAESVSQP